MTRSSILTLVAAGLAAGALANTAGAQTQAQPERAVEQYECKEVMRDSGSGRDVAIAFLHGFLLGKSGQSKFSVEVLTTQTDAFIDRCLNNPNEKALDAMTAVKK